MPPNPDPTTTSPERKLAAILCADVAGYSGLMGRDETTTVQTLSDYRAVVTACVERHNGKIDDAKGDAILAEFASAVNAVSCAVEIQRLLGERNATLPEDRRMRLRIGLNLGDVIVKDGTIYGDGVNVAARLEALAEPGGICISRIVYDSIKNKLPLDFEYLGKKTMKNIAEPVEVFRVSSSRADADGVQSHGWRWVRAAHRGTLVLVGLVLLASAVLGIWLATRSSSIPDQHALTANEDPAVSLPKGLSIAVLPFTNLSGDPAQDFFSDGLTEQIIAALARFNGLYVIARNSTFQYKGRAVDVRKASRELGALYVLEGSVRRSGKTVRVTAQLSDAKRGAQLWAETYDRDLTGTDILALQDSITSSVVASIAGPHGQITRVALEQTTGKAPGSIDSYDCVLRAYAWNRVLSREGHGPLRDCLEAAVARDPDYGEAWAWLAFSYLFEYESGYNPRPELYNALDRALEAGQRAVELDPNNAIVHANLSYVRFLRHELDASIASAERALVLNPNDPAVLCQAGQKMVYSGRNQERGIALTKKAMALGPHYPTWCHYHLSYFHYQKAEYEQALAESLRIDMPDLFWTQVFLAMNYGQLGRTQEAKVTIAKLLKLYPDFARHARRELGNYMPDSAIDHAIDGLRKAGLNVPPDKKIGAKE